MWTVDTYEDLHLRLHGTVGLYENRAVGIEVVRQPVGSNINVVSITSLRDNGKTIKKTVSTQDPKLNVNAFNNGYMNGGSGRNETPYTIFVRRLPLRQQRQAFSFGSCVGFGLFGSGIQPNTSMRDYDLRNNVGLCDLLEDTYPPWKQALAKVLDRRMEKGAMAFARDWAFQSGDLGSTNLWYQTVCVGYFSDKKNMAVINGDINGLSFVINDLDRLGILYTVV